MEDIELVIKISEKDLQNIRKKVFTVEEMFETTQGRVYRAIVNGTPLPKGHGRLVECERLQEVFRRNVVGYAGFKQLFDIAPTIIDKAESEE